MLQQLKALLRDQLGLPPWTVLGIAGLAAHLVCNFLLRKPLTSPIGLAAPFAAGIALEAWEIWLRYRDIGFDAPGVDPLSVILLRHAIDVAAMMVLPLALVIYGALTSR